MFAKHDMISSMDNSSSNNTDRKSNSTDKPVFFTSIFQTVVCPGKR